MLYDKKMPSLKDKILESAEVRTQYKVKQKSKKKKEEKEGKVVSSEKKHKKEKYDGKKRK